MKVRALVSFAGRGFSHAAGDVFDLPPGKERWLTIGFVEPMADAPETAALEAPELAVMPRPRKRGPSGGKKA